MFKLPCCQDIKFSLKLFNHKKTHPRHPRLLPCAARRGFPFSWHHRVSYPLRRVCRIRGLFAL